MPVEALPSDRVFRGGVCVQTHRPTALEACQEKSLLHGLGCPHCQPFPMSLLLTGGECCLLPSGVESKCLLLRPGGWGSAPPNTRAELSEEGGALVVSLGDVPPGTYRHDLGKRF